MHVVKLAKISDGIKMNKITIHQPKLYCNIETLYTIKSVDNYFVHFFEDGQDGTKFKIHSRLQPPLLLPKSEMKLSIRLFLNKFHLCSVFYRAKVLF